MKKKISDNSSMNDNYSQTTRIGSIHRYTWYTCIGVNFICRMKMVQPHDGKF